MSEDGKIFSKKYSFGMDSMTALDFDATCLEKQTRPDSHFVRNIICTRPTAAGRATIYIISIEHVDGLRCEKEIGPEVMTDLLRQHFDVVVHSPRRQKIP
jgi:N-hydroxyarylamine O-acetyltransferase